MRLSPEPVHSLFGFVVVIVVSSFDFALYYFARPTSCSIVLIHHSHIARCLNAFQVSGSGSSPWPSALACSMCKCHEKTVSKREHQIKSIITRKIVNEENEYKFGFTVYHTRIALSITHKVITVSLVIDRRSHIVSFVVVFCGVCGWWRSELNPNAMWTRTPRAVRAEI